jgi:hypothetical protein
MNTKTAVKPKLRGMARANNVRASNATTGTRTAARHRARIEALFDELATERLADLWQGLYPFPIDPDSELPDRQGIIEDLVDFGHVLQPNLDGMNANQLCWLVDKCGRACKTTARAHEHLRASPHRSSRDVRRRHRHRFVIRAGCELL